MSGPVRRPAGAVAAGAPAHSGSSRRVTSTFDRVRALPDHRVVDGLLRSRAWIWVIGIALGGIVFMQVHLLKLNSGIGRAVETSSTLERQNAALHLSVARLSSGQRIEEAAARAGMVTPAAGSVEYVRAREQTDAVWAAKRMRAPTDDARTLLANGGIAPAAPIVPAAGAVADPAAQATTPVTTPETATAPTEAAAPAATAPTTPVPAAVAPVAGP